MLTWIEVPLSSARLTDNFNLHSVALEVEFSTCRGREIILLFTNPGDRSCLKASTLLCETKAEGSTSSILHSKKKEQWFNIHFPEIKNVCFLNNWIPHEKGSLDLFKEAYLDSLAFPSAKNQTTLYTGVPFSYPHDVEQGWVSVFANSHPPRYSWCTLPLEGNGLHWRSSSICGRFSLRFWNPGKSVF